MDKATKMKLDYGMGYIQAKKNTHGNYNLFWIGSRKEVYDLEFKSPKQARDYHRYKLLQQ